jgi:5-methyltetrahydrofolate--homocysteine methyltransferase
MGFDANVKLTKENFKNLPPLCTDGAWGTEMQKLGAQPGQMCDVWNTEAPEKVLSVAKGYLDAGSQVILTNTFNSNRVVLAKHHIAERAFELSREGAAISKKAAQGKAYVFASIGPCGKLVMMGEIDPAEVEEAAAEQAKAFEEGGADAIVIETQSDLVEVEAMAKGVLRATNLPFGFSFTFDCGECNDRTMMGVSIPEVYSLAKQCGASFAGANCGAGIETFAAIARAFTACGSDMPVWVKGNAGKPEIDVDGKTVYRAKPEVYSGVVGELLDAGAKFIGGCCGSSPDHIRAVAQAMAARQ